MRRRRPAALALAVALALTSLIAGRAARADRLVADLSEHEIELKYSFTGRTLLLFGAIDHEGPAEGAGGYDLVLVIRGPDVPLVVRRKARVVGLWINRDSATYPAVPGFYAMVSSRPLPDVAPPDMLDGLGLGLARLELEPETPGPDVADFRAGLIRNLEHGGLYATGGNVQVLRNTLFRASFDFPSNVPEGDYEAEAFLFKDGNLLAEEKIPLVVEKAGVARAINSFANQYPAAYGLIAVLLALLAGWLAAVVARD